MQLARTLATAALRLADQNNAFRWRQLERRQMRNDAMEQQGVQNILQAMDALTRQQQAENQLNRQMAASAGESAGAQGKAVGKSGDAGMDAAALVGQARGQSAAFGAARAADARAAVEQAKAAAAMEREQYKQHQNTARTLIAEQGRRTRAEADLDYKAALLDLKERGLGLQASKLAEQQAHWRRMDDTYRVLAAQNKLAASDAAEAKNILQLFSDPRSQIFLDRNYPGAREKLSQRLDEILGRNASGQMAEKLGFENKAGPAPAPAAGPQSTRDLVDQLLGE